MSDEEVQITVDILEQREFSLHVGDGKRQVWIAKSLIIEPYKNELDDLKLGQSVNLVIPEWLAYEKGLI